jgi:hypothetical protein
MTANAAPPSRGRTWFRALAGPAKPVGTGPGTVLAADATLAGEPVRLLAIAPDPQNRFPRARQQWNADIRKRPGDLTGRLDNDGARAHRAASIEVRRKLMQQWNATHSVLQE